MNRLSIVSICAIDLCSVLVALTVFSNALPADDNRGPNPHVKTLVKRSISSSSCYCCLATYDISCCHACTRNSDSPIPFYAPEKKRGASSSGESIGAELASLDGGAEVSQRHASIADLSLVACTCCQSSQSKSCCEMCKITLSMDTTASEKNSLPSGDTSGLVRKRGFNLGSSYSTCMCCTLTRWRGCCYRCPYGF